MYTLAQTIDYGVYKIDTAHTDLRSNVRAYTGVDLCLVTCTPRDSKSPSTTVSTPATYVISVEFSIQRMRTESMNCRRRFMQSSSHNSSYIIKHKSFRLLYKPAFLLYKIQQLSLQSLHFWQNQIHPNLTRISIMSWSVSTQLVLNMINYLGMPNVLPARIV